MVTSNHGFDKVYSGKHALITGGMGFIGSNLAVRLVRLGMSVTVMDTADPDTGANPFNLSAVKNAVEVVNSDIRDGRQLRSILAGKDFLFNLAGLSSHVGGMLNPEEDLKVNALAQLGILNSCKEANPGIRIVFAGTRQVYGNAKSLPVREDDVLQPVDFNGVSKLAGELYHMVAARVYGLWTTSLRLTNTYGPGMRVKDPRQTFVGHWIRLLLDGEPITIFGDGTQMRDFNFVDDVAAALLMSAAMPPSQGMIYNLGAPPVRLLDLASLMIRLNGSGEYVFQPFPVERRRIGIRDYAGDYSKIHAELGWRPEVELEGGLAQTLEYYRLNRKHYW